MYLHLPKILCYDLLYDFYDFLISKYIAIFNSEHG